MDGNHDLVDEGRREARRRFGRHLERHSYYPYPGPPPDFEVGPTRRRGSVDATDICFQSVLPSGIAENDRVTARLFRGPPSRSGRPVVFLHGLGVPRLSAWDSLAAGMAARGFPTLLVGLPYTCERTPHGERRGHAYLSIEADTALPAYEQAVADARSGLDWLLSGPPCLRGGAEFEGATLLGLSLGAFVAVMAAAMEPRFDSLVCVFGGGDLDAVVFRGTYAPLIRRQLDRAGITLENRRRARLEYEEYLERVRGAAHPLDVEAPFHYFLFDPLTFAHHLRERPVLLISALLDPIVPPEASRRLRLELGRPESSLLWGTHWAGGPWRPFVQARIARFLRGLGER
jgi:pimeloyl-ACP methyl ester carboxylesterase